jgi:RNA polymerase sigma-70 factor (ECF subfamily)
MMTRSPSDEWPDNDLAALSARDPDSPEGRRAACILLQRYARPVYRWCYDRTRDPEMAEDLSQEALLRAYRNLGRFAGWGRFSAWLYVLTRNLCREKLRRPSILHDPEIDPDLLPDTGLGPEGMREQLEEESEFLALVRENLSDLEQDAIWMRCLEGMSVEAITEALRIEQATGARAVLQTARR